VQPFKPVAYTILHNPPNSAITSLQLPALPASFSLPLPQLSMQQSAQEISQIIAESAGSRKVTCGGAALPSASDDVYAQVTKDSLLRGHLGGKARRNTSAGL
jgi:hypothetical protein